MELGGEGPIFLRAGKLSTQGIDWTKPERFRDQVSKLIAPSKIGRAGDTMVTTKGNSVGRTGFVSATAPEFIYSPHLSYWRSLDLERVDSGFIRYWAQGPEFRQQLRALAHGTDMAPYLSLGDQERLVVTLPGIVEQRGIAATLGALDDKIESNRRSIQSASELLDALSATLTDSIASVPLADVVEVQRVAVDPATLADRQVDLFSLPAFDDGVLPERVSASAIMSGKLAIRRPSVLVSRLNPRFNRTWWVVPKPGIPALASTEFACLTANSREDLAAVWLTVRDEYFRAELVRRAGGTSGSHQRIRTDDLLAIDVPDLRGLSADAKSAPLALLDLVDQRRSESAMLANLRDTLLPELLSGRIRVPEAREALEEAVG